MRFEALRNALCVPLPVDGHVRHPALAGGGRAGQQRVQVERAVDRPVPMVARHHHARRFQPARNVERAQHLAHQRVGVAERPQGERVVGAGHVLHGVGGEHLGDDEVRWVGAHRQRRRPLQHRLVAGEFAHQVVHGVAGVGVGHAVGEPGGGQRREPPRRVAPSRGTEPALVGRDRLQVARPLQHLVRPPRVVEGGRVLGAHHAIAEHRHVEARRQRPLRQRRCADVVGVGVAEALPVPDDVAVDAVDVGADAGEDRRAAGQRGGGDVGGDAVDLQAARGERPQVRQAGGVARDGVGGDAVEHDQEDGVHAGRVAGSLVEVGLSRGRSDAPSRTCATRSR